MEDQYSRYFERPLNHHNSAMSYGDLTRACEHTGSGRIPACRSNLFLWLPLILQPIFFTPTHHFAPAHQIFGPLCSHSAPIFKQQTEKSGPIFHST